MKREFRIYKAREVRLSGDGKIIDGYAAVFNQPSENLGWFREIVKPGAFTRCLGTSPDVRCLFNHDPSSILGRTKSGTLRLNEDSTGLHFECDLDATAIANDVRSMVKRGDIDQCSFGFTVNSQNWMEDKDSDGNMQTTRELTDVDVFDVSPVTYPAYPQTSVEARSLWPDGEPESLVEYRKKASEKSAETDALPDDFTEVAKRRAVLAVAIS